MSGTIVCDAVAVSRDHYFNTSHWLYHCLLTLFHLEGDMSEVRVNRFEVDS